MTTTDSPATDAALLGSENDLRPIPLLRAWADSASNALDVREYAIQSLRLKLLRPFHIDLSHRLHIIIRAQGGYHRGGLKRAAALLGVSRISIQRWLKGTAFPSGTKILDKLDAAYADSFEILVRAACTSKRRRKRTNSLESDLAAIVAFREKLNVPFPL
jgi:hypothetical protein